MSGFSDMGSHGPPLCGVFFRVMPRGLIRYQQTGDLHFITFSCYRRQAYLGAAAPRELFESALARIGRRYNFVVTGYVVMPEHVHLRFRR